MKAEEEISPSHVLCYGEDGGSVIRIELISVKRGSSYNSEWPVEAVSEKPASTQIAGINSGTDC